MDNISYQTDGTKGAWAQNDSHYQRPVLRLAGGKTERAGRDRFFHPCRSLYLLCGTVWKLDGRRIFGI